VNEKEKMIRFNNALKKDEEKEKEEFLYKQTGTKEK